MPDRDIDNQKLWGDLNRLTATKHPRASFVAELEETLMPAYAPSQPNRNHRLQGVLDRFSRNFQVDHPGIDIANAQGTTIYAPQMAG